MRHGKKFVHGRETRTRRITVRFKPSEKDALKEVKDDTGLSYAELIREAVHAYYSSYFNRK